MDGFSFSVSSFIDLINAIACLVLSRRLFASYAKGGNKLVRNFAYFYLVFAVFFLFLGLPFFIPSQSDWIQLSFATSHFFLYSAMAIFLYVYLELLGMHKISKVLPFFTVLIGAIIYFLSLVDGGEARLFVAVEDIPNIVSWSHGGREIFRMLIGLSGMFLGFATGFTFIYFSMRKIKSEDLRKKSSILGYGLITLGLAAFLAFVLSFFNFYNFWIVLAAELTTITGLLLIYRAVSLGWASLQHENVI